MQMYGGELCLALRTPIEDLPHCGILDVKRFIFYVFLSLSICALHSTPVTFFHRGFPTTTWRMNLWINPAMIEMFHLCGRDPFSSC